MRNMQDSNSIQAATPATSGIFAAHSTQAVLTRDDVRPGIFYWAVDRKQLHLEPELLSSGEARQVGEHIALFLYERKARSYQQKKLKAQQHQH